jgi:hypothetical protein
VHVSLADAHRHGQNGPGDGVLRSSHGVTVSLGESREDNNAKG